jgi:DNA-binding CsgD family transcriptional regulator
MREENRKRIAGLLYDGILSPQDWFGGMESLNEALGGFNFHQLTVDVRQGVVLESVCSAMDVQGVETYERHFALTDERVPVLTRLGQGQIMLDHEHFDARHISRSALYSEFLASMGMKHTMGLMLRVEGNVQQYLGVMRHLDRPHFTERELSFARHLMPDCIRAAHLRDRAGRLARQALLGVAALDTLPQALAVVDAQCRLQYSNPFADRLLAHTGVLRVRHGRLECTDAPADARWRHQVARACGSEGPATAGGQNLIGERDRLVVTVLPLKASHAVAVHWQTPLALVVLADPGVRANLSPQLIAQMLGLTPTEARMAVLLATGRTVKDFAATQGCTLNTARTHLANLLGKTGCRRQADLVGLLQSLRMG